jgi:hypothetical protein
MAGVVYWGGLEVGIVVGGTAIERLDKVDSEIRSRGKRIE